MTLYHGTTKENYSEIIKNNILNGPVYLTPSKKTAEEYAANNSADYVVFEINIEESLLLPDDEFCKESFTVEESISNGSVYVDCDVDISKAKIYFYEDFELID